MDENQVKQIVAQMLSQSQYKVGPVQYHTHNGVDSALLSSGGVGLPANPAQGDIIYYNGTAWVLLATGSSGQVLETKGASANPVWATQLPTGSQGDVLYFNGSIWTNLAAGTSGQFLETQGFSAYPKWAFSIYTGSVILFGTATPPTGYLLCNGQGVSTSTYATLFSLIGYTYGGSGETFNLPNLNATPPLNYIIKT